MPPGKCIELIARVVAQTTVYSIILNCAFNKVKVNKSRQKSNKSHNN